MALNILLLLVTIPFIFGVPTHLVNEAPPILKPETDKLIAIPNPIHSPIYRAHIPISPIVPKPYRAKYNSVDYSKLQQNANASHKKFQAGAIRGEYLAANSGRNLQQYHNDNEEINSGNTKLVKANNKYLLDNHEASINQRRLDAGQNHYISSDLKSNRNIKEGSSSIQSVHSPVHRTNYDGIIYNHPLVSPLRGSRPRILDEKDQDVSPNNDDSGKQDTDSKPEPNTNEQETNSDNDGLKNDGQGIPNSGEKLVDNKHIKQSISADIIKQQHNANAHLRKYQQGDVRDESKEINSKSNLDKLHGDYSRSKTGDTDIVNKNYDYTKDARQAGDKERRLDVGKNHFISSDQYSDRNLNKGSSGVQIINSPGYKEYKLTNRTSSEKDHHSRSFRKYVYGNKYTGSEETSAPTTTDGEYTTADWYNTNTTPDPNWFTATATSISSDQGTTSTDEGTTSTDEGTTNDDQGTTNNDQDTTTCDEDVTSSDEGTTSSDQDTTSSDQGTTSSDQGTTNNDQDTTPCDDDVTSSDQETTSSDQDTTSSDQGTTSSDQGTTNNDQDTTTCDEDVTSNDQPTDGTVTVTYFTTPKEEIKRTVQKSKELNIKKSSQQSIDENQSLSSNYQASDGSVSNQETKTIDKHLTSNKSLEKDLTVKKVIVEKGSY